MSDGSALARTPADARRGSSSASAGPIPADARDCLYWICWAVAVVGTGLVAGLMLGHALILAPFLDWLLVNGSPATFASAYPVFRATTGAAGLTAYYVLSGAQVAAALAFLAVAVAMRRHRVAAAIAAAASIGWVIAHYASGFGAVERRLFGSASAGADVASRFLAWNTPLHFLHAGLLITALLALLCVPMRALGDGQRRATSA